MLLQTRSLERSQAPFQEHPSCPEGSHFPTSYLILYATLSRTTAAHWLCSFTFGHFYMG